MLKELSQVVTRKCKKKKLSGNEKVVSVIKIEDNIQ